MILIVDPLFSPIRKAVDVRCERVASCAKRSLPPADVGGQRGKRKLCCEDREQQAVQR